MAFRSRTAAPPRVTGVVGTVSVWSLAGSNWRNTDARSSRSWWRAPVQGDVLGGDVQVAGELAGVTGALEDGPVHQALDEKLWR